jgi:hypothetical protein
MEYLPTNGIDATTGAPLMPELDEAALARLALGQPLDPAAVEDARRRAFQLSGPDRGVEADPNDLQATGWGLVLPADSDPAILEALQPLLDLRHSQAGERFRLFAGPDGYQPGETKRDFLKRFRMGAGPVNPERVPYYLLLAGTPVQIPYHFQYQLDVQYAVGRLGFDSPADYHSYTQSVLRAECGALPPRRAPAFFAPANPDDRATQASASLLAAPLAEWLQAGLPTWGQPAAQTRALIGLQAAKAGLSALLDGSAPPPALLFAAGHGLGYPAGDPRQRQRQGALICQDWPGPKQAQGPVREADCFAAADLPAAADLTGLVGFFFACYSAGVPAEDELAPLLWPAAPERRRAAPEDFISALPQRLLAQGALALVGHVDRAWAASFYLDGAGPQLQVFQDALQRLFKDRAPIGYALEVFNNRYAELAAELGEELAQVRDFGKQPDPKYLASLWTAHNDARNYLLLGDPAVRVGNFESTIS